MDDLYQSFSEPSYVKARDIHNTRHTQALRKLNPRTNEIVKLADNLLLDDEITMIFFKLHSLDKYYTNALLIRDLEQEARDKEWWQYRVGDMEFWRKAREDETKIMPGP